MTTETIHIVVREDGSRVVKRNIEDIGKAADDAAGFLDTMKNVLLSIAAGGVIAGLLKMADTYTTIQNRLRLVTAGTENLARVTKELQGIANSTRTDFAATAELYSRMATSSKELGLSQKDLLTFTKSLNQAIVLSGASAEEAAGGLRQLSQGMASGTLRGDELNSVMENFPKVADVISEGLGITRGELRKLGAEGKITANDIIDAFKKAEKSLGEDFAKTVPTVGQAFTVLKNNFLTFIGELDQSLGITKAFSEMIITISNNLNTLIPILAGVAVAIATAFAPGIISAFASQIRGLFLLISAHPLGALATVIAGVVTALFMMRDQIKLGIDDTTTLGDLMRAIWEQVVPAIQELWATIKSFYQLYVDITKSALGIVSDSFDGMFSDVESGWLGVVRAVARTTDAILGLLLGLADGAMRIFASVAAGVSTLFSNAARQIKAVMDGDFAEALSIGAQQLNVVKQTGVNIGEAMGKGLDTGFGAMMEGGFESKLNKAIKRAQEIGKDRQKPGGDLIGGGPSLVKPPIDEDAAKKAAKELERLKNALQNVMDEADPVGAATRRLAEAQNILTRAVKAGLIEQQKADEVYSRLKDLMKDQLDPLGALNRELDENIALLKLSNNERQIEGDILMFTEQLKRDGVILTKEETAALRAKLTVEQELARIAQAKDSMRSQTKGGRDEEFASGSEALKQLMEEGGVTGGDKFNIVNQLLGGSLDDTQAMFDAQMEQFAEYYARIAELRDLDVLNAKEASDAIAAIKRAELEVTLNRTEQALGAAAGLMQSNSKKAFEVGRAAAIGQAIVNTYTGATAAFQSAAAIPYVGWIMAPIAAAGAIAAGMAQVSAIRSQQMPAYRTGGSYTVGGSGGVDSQTVAFRASPGEQVSINTPAQARAMERMAEMAERGGGRGDFTQNVTIVQQGKPDRKTAGQQARAVRKQTQAEYERVK